MSDIARKIFDKLYKEFEDRCKGWLITNTSLRRSGYDKWYKEELFNIMEAYRREVTVSILKHEYQQTSEDY